MTREEALLLEYRRLCDEIFAIEKRTSAFFSFSSALLALGFSYVLKEKVVGAAVILIVIAILACWHVIYEYQSVQSKGGYKRTIEETLNTGFSKKALIWENGIMPFEKANVPKLVVLAVSYMLLILLVGNCLFLVGASSFDDTLKLGITLFSLVGMLSFPIGLFFAQRKFNDVTLRARELLEVTET